MRELFNLRFEKEKCELKEEELKTIEIALGYDPMILTKDTKDLVDWWDKKIIHEITRIMGVTLKEEVRQESVLTELGEKEYVNLDFLGYGIISPRPLREITGRHIVYPTLTRERIQRSLIYSKAERGLKETKIPTDMKLSLMSLSKYQSLFLAGGWYEPICSKLLPAMFFRDSANVMRNMGAAEAAIILASLLKDEGFSVPSNTYLASGLFSFEALNNIMLDETARSALKTKASLLEDFLEKNFGFTNHDVPIDIVTEQTQALVPLLNEVVVRTEKNTSTDILGVQKVFTESSAAHTIRQEWSKLPIIERGD